MSSGHLAADTGLFNISDLPALPGFGNFALVKSKAKSKPKPKKRANPELPAPVEDSEEPQKAHLSKAEIAVLVLKQVECKSKWDWCSVE